MKLYLSQINQLFSKIEKDTIKGLLLYGPDKGYISKTCELTIKKFDLLPTTISYCNLKASQLAMTLNSNNFFNKREFIKVISVPSALDPTIKLILESDFFHFVVFIADELSPASSTRKFFEAENKLASIACYHDDEQGILKILLKKCEMAGKTIEPQAVNYLKSYLKGDHNLIISEINKLLYFVNDQNRITLDNVQQVISKNLMASSDELCIYFINKNPQGFLNELVNLKQQGINEILIIRALIRYYLNLYIVLSRTIQGSSLDNAITQISPPIFFKYITDFKKAATSLTIATILKALSILQQAEVDFKLKPDSFDFYQAIYLPIIGSEATI